MLVIATLHRNTSVAVDATSGGEAVSECLDSLRAKSGGVVLDVVIEGSLALKTVLDDVLGLSRLASRFVQIEDFSRLKPIEFEHFFDMSREPSYNNKHKSVLE